MAGKSYNFNELKIEKMKGVEYQVIQPQKYIQSRDAAIKLIESDLGKKAGLTETDFWIQKNYSTKTANYCIYSALVLVHDAFVKINGALEEGRRFNGMAVSELKHFGQLGSGEAGYYLEYRDDDAFIIASVSQSNCKISYPLEVLSKRLFDRVVKFKAGLCDIFSDAETFDEDLAVSQAENQAENMPAPSTKKAATEDIPPADAPVEVKAEPEEKKAEKKTEKKAASKKTEVCEEIIEGFNEEALNHIFEGLTAADGKELTIKALVESEKLTDDQKVARLEKFKEGGTSADIAACTQVLAGIKDGSIQLINSK